MLHIFDSDYWLIFRTGEDLNDVQIKYISCNDERWLITEPTDNTLIVDKIENKIR